MNTQASCYCSSKTIFENKLLRAEKNKKTCITLQIGSIAGLVHAYITLQTGPVVGLTPSEQCVEQTAEGPNVDGLAVGQVVAPLWCKELLRTRVPCAHAERDN